VPLHPARGRDLGERGQVLRPSKCLVTRGLAPDAHADLQHLGHLALGPGCESGLTPGVAIATVPWSGHTVCLGGLL
jgi:hypothetical protein